MTLAAIVLVLGVREAAAQPECPDGRIARVRVHSQGVFDESDNGMVSRLSSAIEWLHVETREGVIRRELLFVEGDCYDAFRVRESERLLRELRFLREATVRPSRRSDGDVTVSVVTADDWSLRLEPQIDFGGGLGFNGMSVGEMNLGGTGGSVELFYYDRPGRDEFGISHSQPQLGGTRWDLDVTASRTEPGWFLRGLVSYPFVGLVGRAAAFQDVSFGERWFRFVTADGPTRRELVLPFERYAVQLGGAFRRGGGPPATAPRLFSYGASVSYERLRYERAFFEDTLSGGGPPMSEILANAELGTIRSRHSLRFNLLAGVQALKFVKRPAVRTLQAVEDLPVGVMADLVLGVGSRELGSSDSHLIVGFDGGGSSIVADDWLSTLDATLEARRDYRTGEWRDVFAAAEWSHYWFSGGGHTLELRARSAAGWRTTVPFQLTLGGADGLRGYARHRFPGGARALVTLEDRMYLGSVANLFDMGTAAFVDAGRAWSNGAPFGADSGIRASMGAGLRVAAPPGSRLTYRLDLGVPIESDVGWDDLTLTLHIQRPINAANGVVDLQLERSRDLPLRTAVRQLK